MILIYLFKDETIKTHAHAFLTLNISTTGTVHFFKGVPVSIVYICSAIQSKKCNLWPFLHNFATYPQGRLNGSKVNTTSGIQNANIWHSTIFQSLNIMMCFYLLSQQMLLQFLVWPESGVPESDILISLVVCIYFRYLWCNQSPPEKVSLYFIMKQ